MLYENLVYEDDSAYVFVNELDSSQNQVIVKFKNPKNSENRFTTSYPKSIISQISKVKTPAWLEDEINGEESEVYLKLVLKISILSYLKHECFTNKLILDFGSGSGSSTIILSKLFPDSEIIGIEMVDEFIKIAEEKIKFLGLKNVKFIKSESPEYLPKNIKSPDFIVMSRVYEHLLPKEREGIFLEIWNLLKTGGVLFIIETPYSLYPIEFHTTQGLPLINYLPDNLA
ncbi:MAG: class I SAM-dependent methyltransferase [Candidatus Kapaibacterium sp.]